MDEPAEGWILVQVLSAEDDSGEHELLELHWIPHNDSHQHEPHGECWCCPELEDECDEEELPIFVHNAHDQRELYEQRRRKPH